MLKGRDRKLQVVVASVSPVCTVAATGRFMQRQACLPRVCLSLYSV